MSSKLIASFELFNFFTIFKESIILLPKNGKLMAFSTVFYSIFFLLYNYSLQSLTKDIYIKIIASEITFVLVISIVSFFLGIATILVSATSYTKNTTSLKNLFSMVGKKCVRTMITTFYVFGLTSGYILTVLSLVAVLVMYQNPVANVVFVLLVLHTWVLFLYLFVSWILAIVVSVIEENCYGVDALRRASSLVEGNRMEGFMINFCFSILGFIISVGLSVYGVFVANISCLLSIWLLVAYTVLYFQCKKYCGEGMELQGSVEYDKLRSLLV